MSRSGYSYDFSEWDRIRWRGAVESALRGRRGQAFLVEMRAALDAMPEKRLIEDALVTPDGQVCAIGSVFKARGTDVSDLDPDDYEQVAKASGLADAMVREIAHENDECYYGRPETPEARWLRMRAWVDKQIAASEPLP